jgi:hypothetical protein
MATDSTLAVVVEASGLDFAWPFITLANALPSWMSAILRFSEVLAEKKASQLAIISDLALVAWVLEVRFVLAATGAAAQNQKVTIESNAKAAWAQRREDGFPILFTPLTWVSACSGWLGPATPRNYFTLYMLHGAWDSRCHMGVDGVAVISPQDRSGHDRNSQKRRS